MGREEVGIGASSFFWHPFLGFFTLFSCKFCDGCKFLPGFPGWYLQHLREPAISGEGEVRTSSRIILTANSGNFPPFSDSLGGGTDDDTLVALGCKVALHAVRVAKGLKSPQYFFPLCLHQFIIFFAIY